MRYICLVTSYSYRFKGGECDPGKDGAHEYACAFDTSNSTAAMKSPPSRAKLRRVTCEAPDAQSSATWYAAASACTPATQLLPFLAFIAIPRIRSPPFSAMSESAR